MNSNIKYIGVALGAGLIGLLFGYLLWSGQEQVTQHENEHENRSEIVNSTSQSEIWTCSMHPQIRQNEPGDCPICGMDLIPLTENSSDNPLVLEITHEAVKLANIQTTIVGETNGQVHKSIRLSGKIQPDERLASTLVAHVPGRIERLFVSFTGEKVRKGQKIATIFSPDLITAQRELLEAVKLKDLNPELVVAARKKLSFWKIPKESIQQIETNNKIIEIFTVYADESGIVENKRISVGDYVKVGEALFDLIDISRVWVLFDAYEDELPHISVGDQITFTTPSIPDRTFETRVSFIDPVINPQTRVASIRTEVRNSNGLFKPEMLVYGTVRSHIKNGNNLTVPKSSVLWTGERSVVYVKVPDVEIPSFEFKEIQIGESLGESYVVVSGLDPGEEVVTYGSFSIDAAAQLNNQTSMMNRNVTIQKKDSSAKLPDYRSETPEGFVDQLHQLVSSYLLLKDALVNSDDQGASAAAERMLTQLQKIDMSKLNGEAHEYWMQQQKAINAHGAQILSAEQLEAQRNQFDFLSQAIIKAIQVFGVGGSTFYVQHCPMAKDNQGADWISLEEEIRNPYFGDKMLKCGVVKMVVKD